MSTRSELAHLSRVRLRDAEVLFRNKRYSAAVYLAGYAIEFALKARICERFAWKEYKLSREYDSFKTHDLDKLLSFAGRSRLIDRRYSREWLIVKSWKSQHRYESAGSTKRAEAELMLRHTRTLLRVL